MPKLIVYVPASLWRRIEELGLADPKVEARKVAVGALEDMVNGSLSERGGEQQPSQRTEKVVEARRSDQTATPERAARSESDQHFKPDPK